MVAKLLCVMIAEKIENQGTENLGSKTVKNIVWTGGGAGIRIGISLLVLAVLARLLCPADFGIIAAAMLVVNFADIFAFVGVGPAVVQRTDLTPTHIRTAFTVTIALGAIVTVLLGLASPLVEMLFKIEKLTSVIAVLSLIFVIKSFGVIAESMLMRQLRFKRLAFLEAFSYAAGYGAVSIGLVLMGVGYWGLVAGTLFQAILKSILMVLSVRHSLLPGFNAKAFKDLVHFGAGYSLARIINFFATQGDYLVVGRLLGADALGLYSRAFRIMQMPSSLFNSVVDNVIFSAYSRTQYDKERIYRGFERGLSLTALMGLPMSAVLFILAPDIVLTLLGDKWSAAIGPFHVLSIAAYPLLACKQSGTMLLARSKVYLFASLQFVYASMVLAGALSGTKWGLMGVTVGVCIAVLLYYLLLTIAAIKTVGMPLASWFKAHKPGFFCMILFGSISWLGATIGQKFLLPPVSLLLNGALLLAALLVIRRMKSELFLGKDGLWLEQQVVRLASVGTRNS